MAISIIVTGGTFDKEYNELNGSLFFKETHVSDMLLLGRSKVDLEVKTLMLIDSLDMTELHRNEIVDACNNCTNNQIVLTHGTDTLTQTASVLAEAIKDKTIVITGAMIPYKFGSSDGLFNLGSALAFAQTLAPGVYIAMNGRYYDWNNCRKNKATGYFEELI
jgi:L-asparaginase